MKHFIKIFKHHLLVILLLLNVGVMSAQAQDSLATNSMDSVQISLLTCQPGDAVYYIYGHTAIRYQDKLNGTDLVINYGMFDQSKPNFLLRFVFGLTDYYMGVEPFSDFVAQYEYENRGVIQQTLNLTAQEKQAIAKALDENYKPENRVYRYNYFYDNCTTRAEEIIVSNIKSGKLKSQHTEYKEGWSYRKLIDKWDKDYPWYKFGNDLLLGVGADINITTNNPQYQFLPDDLYKVFDTATVIKGGSERKLVSSTQVIIPYNNNVDKTPSFLSPTICAVILLILTILITCIERIKRIKVWWYDIILMIAGGLAGIILTAMIFSEHPTVSLNLQILVLNPLPLFFLYPILRGKALWFGKLSIILICLFFAGNFVQDYAEGMNLIALSFLLRYLSLSFPYKK